MRDAASSDWCLFWQFHVLDWAERSNSPDLGYYYSFTCTLKRVVRSTNGTHTSTMFNWKLICGAVLFHRVFPTYWAKWSLQEAAQHPQPEFMLLQTKLFNTMFSQPDWDLLTNGFEQALKLWREMKPEHLEYYRSSDSQISYEDSLATYGAGLLVIGNFRRTYEVGFSTKYVISTAINTALLYADWTRAVADDAWQELEDIPRDRSAAHGHVTDLPSTLRRGGEVADRDGGAGNEEHQ